MGPLWSEPVRYRHSQSSSRQLSSLPHTPLSEESDSTNVNLRFATKHVRGWPARSQGHPMVNQAVPDIARSSDPFD
jgi:hypothetical protein